MKSTIATLALLVATSLFAQRPLPRSDEQNQRIKRGVFVRAGILGVAGLCATQLGDASMRNAGWVMFGASGVSIFAVQITIGDRVTEETKRRHLSFIKHPY